MVRAYGWVSMNNPTQSLASDRWVNQVHQLGQFGRSFGCRHCGVVFSGCRNVFEANQRLEMHRAAVKEEHDRRERGESNLLEDSL